MTLPGVNPDIEAQANTIPETQPAIIPNPPPTSSANPQLSMISDLAQAASTNEHYDRNAPAQQTAETPQVQRDENQGDSSDGLWSIYLTEAEKQDTQVIESWKGDTDGILVFTGLFSATVAGFLIESYKKLSPDSSDTTNALLAQISVQLVNISNGTPLASIAVQSGQPFKPTPSAVRVNVLWFLSLVLSLNCALSATLMQQWARRYQELAQRRGAFHRRGRMRAYIFDGINRFGMARAVATMPTLLHISVFLFFAGLVEFLFPIYKSVAYATLGCIMVFVLAYAVLTVLPTIYLNCPYATPLSGITWRISQLSSFVFLWTTLKLAGLFHKPLFKLWGLTNRHAPGRHGPERWRETLNKRVKFRRQRLSQSLRKSVELSAYRAQSTVVTSALEWTLTALDEDKEIEDFAARVPGFFDSRVVPDATSAVLSLISHQPNTDPIFGSRLYDLLKTCIPGTSLLDEKMRKNRLRVCLKCLWYILRAYSHPGVSQPLPSYFPNSLIPEIVRRVQTEEDFTLRAIGHCVIAVVISKLAADVKSRTIIVNDGVLTFLSPVLDTEGHDLEFLHNQPGTVALANMISLSFGEVGTLAAGAVPPDVLDLVQQTLTILSRALLAQEKAELQLGQEVSETDGSYRKFGRILVPHVLYFLNTGVRTPSRLTGEVRTSILRMCLKRLWFTGRAFNQGGKSMPSPSDLHITFSHPEMIRGIYEHQDPAVRTIGRCVGALVVNNLAVDLNSRIIPASHAELECLSTVLSIGDRSLEPLLLLRQPGAVSLATMISLVFDEAGTWATNTVPFGVPDMIQQTFIILSQTLLAELQPGRTITIIDGPDRKFERVLESHLFYFLTCIRRPWHLMEEARTSCLRMCLKGLWRVGRAFSQLRHSKPFLPYISMAFTIPRISELPDLAAREIGCCVGALVVKKIAADLISRTDSISGEELECLSAILGTEDNDVMRLLRHPGAIEFTNMVFLAANIDSLSARVPSDVLDVIRETFIILSHDLPDELNVKTWLDQTDTLINGSDGITSLNPDLYKRSLQMCLKNLWDVVRASNERGSSVPLPLYIYVAFTDSVMTRRIHKDADPTTALIGHCVGALLVNKHVSDLKSRAVPASDEELACISVILGTQSHNVTRWLRHPGATELAGVVSLVSDVVRSLVTSVVPSDVLDVVQQTLDLVSQALPEERIAQQQPDRTIPPISISDDDFERIISYNLEEFLKACISNTSPITMEVRTSCLRIFLKSLWYFARLYHQLDASTPMPSYFPLTYASTEITHLIQTELDPSTRVVGRCFEALVVDKLMEDTNSLTDEGVACISAILGKESHIVWHWLNQPGAIDLRNVISVISDEIDTFVADELSPDVLEILQQTLSIIARNIVRGHRSADEDLYMEQVLYFHSIFSIVADAGGADWFKYRLEWILSQLPAVEDRNRWRSDLISDRQLSEYGTDSDSTG